MPNSSVANPRPHPQVYRKVALQLVRAGARPVPVEEGQGQEGNDTAQQVAADGSSSSSSSAGSLDRQSSTSSSGSTGSSTSSSGSSEAGQASPASGASGPGAASEPGSAAGGDKAGAGGPGAGAQRRMRVEYDGPPIVVSKAQLKDYVGQAPFAKDKFYETTPPGATGKHLGGVRGQLEVPWRLVLAVEDTAAMYAGVIKPS